ncbi:MAG: hypothetical protein HC918_06785 [Oscillatoriales cyanobacterium SM2_1_8]|nr:hypothetical protein [Oscillatoriales cyanobacterium SM2_1_8]
MVSKPRRLIVEGADDKRVIPQIIEAHGIAWGETRAEAIVHIEDYDGVENLMKAIGAELKRSELQALGIAIDADEDWAGCWRSLQQAWARSIPNFPETLPEEGLITKMDNDIQFGVWIMPDNRSRGMLETFLSYLVPEPTDAIWEYAQAAQRLGASFRDVHRDKAQMHTWLAWQDPPGQQLHLAVKQQILRPGHPKAQAFVDWFRKLYSL